MKTLAAAAVAAVAGAAAVLGSAGDPAEARATRSVGEQLRELREATAEYRSVHRAKRDGYRAASPCVPAPDGRGAMGIHYVHARRAADRKVSLRRPEALLYIRGKDGRRRLVGVEYIVPDADQDLATDDDRPSLFGRPFDGPMPGHSPGEPVHYDLHVWVWQDNPAGRFSPFNPTLRCR